MTQFDDTLYYIINNKSDDTIIVAVYDTINNTI